MALTPPHLLNRRELLKALGLGAGALTLGTQLLRSRTAAAATTPKRFVQINLEGGWDSSLATDPIVGAKTGVDTYEQILRTPSTDLMPATVPGKANLIVGPGLAPALPAFASLPTAFINGMHMEVTAHDFAAQFMSSGRLSLSNSRDYPAIPAVLGAALPTYPPHVALGMLPPLGDTRFTSPPLHAYVPDALASMMSGPSGDRYRSDLIADAHKLIGDLDALTYGRMSAVQQESLKLWRDSSQRVDEIYAKKLGGLLTASDELKARYKIDQYPSDAELGPESRLSSLYLLMLSNLCPYVTVTFGSFDTHENQMATHLPLMRRFANALNVFIADLLATDDPASPGHKLADTTTILITSEFVRSPRFSTAGGTEHWQSASAILMGRTVKDGAVFGATATDATALGWNGARPEPLTFENRLLPNHMVATILGHLGTQEQANAVSEERIHGLFI